MPKEYTIHVVAPAEFSQIKPALEKLQTVNNEVVSISVTGWDYSYSSMAHWAETDICEVPDIVLLFDTAEYPRVNADTGSLLHYSGMINCIKEIRLKLDSKYVIVLSKDKEENLEFLNELMKLDIHNFYFAKGEFSIEDLKVWIFSPEKTLKNNEKYLIAGQGLALTKVIKEKADPGIEIKEKIITVEKVVKELVSVKFKKLILTVFENPEFACELSYMAAKLSDLNVLLIDLDTLNATADAILNIPKYPSNIRSFDDVTNNTGLNICLDAADKNILSREILLEAAIVKTKSLYILTGNYNLSNFEYYNEQSLERLLEKAYELFDVTILITNGFIYDSFTLISLKKSDHNLFPISADRLSLRKTNRYLALLNEKQKVPFEKSGFVAFEYNPSVDLDKSIIHELTGGSYIGNIRYSEKRRRYRNLKVPFAKNMDKKMVSDYINVLSKFNIIPKKKFADTFRDSFKTGIRSLKNAFRLRRYIKHASD